MSKPSQRPFDDRPKGLPPKHRPKHNSRETPTGNLVGRNINPRDLLEDGDDDDLGGDDDPLTLQPFVLEETASPMISLHKDPNADSPNTPTQG